MNTMKTIYVAFLPGDKVKFRDAEHTGRVYTVTTVDTGSYYGVEWWMDGSIVRSDFYEADLEPIDDQE